MTKINETEINEKKINKDIEYMKLALDLAKKAEGYTNPNPMVGAVVVKDGEILGTGYHKFCGGPHAEVYALDEALENINKKNKDKKNKLSGATIYVTLEPCSHFGKTPPCVEKIKDMKIKKCVIATLDPNPLVAGKGKKILEEAGIEVEVGILEDEAKELNKVFLKYIKDKNPFLFLKCAITLDGKIATKNGNSKWITNELSRAKVQQLRNKFSGIMVGINTLLNDNPRLTARIEDENKVPSNPYRIVIDPNLRIESHLKNNNLNFISQGIEDKKSIIITSINNKKINNKEINNKEINNKINFIEKYEDLNIRFIFMEDTEFKVDDVLKEIGKLGIDSVLLEGGGYLISKAFEENRIDGGEIFIAPKILGGGISFIDGFDFPSVAEGFKLKNPKFAIYDDNISIKF